jgi:hypothetical protein
LIFISWNKIGVEGASKLSEDVSKLEKLTSLYLNLEYKFPIFNKIIIKFVVNKYISCDNKIIMIMNFIQIDKLQRNRC